MHFKYFVYSWNENRNTEWKHEPFMGGMIDGEFNGPPPAPWSIPCVQPGLGKFYSRRFSWFNTNLEIT